MWGHAPHPTGDNILAPAACRDDEEQLHLLSLLIPLLAVTPAS